MNDLTYKSHSTANPGINLRQYLYATVYYFIAIVLLAAGIFKIYDPAPMLGTLDLIQFLNNPLSVFIATILPVIEIALGILLLTGKKIRISLMTATGLFWIFFGFSVYGYAVGLDADCGCFGNVIASDFGVGMILCNALFAVIVSMVAVSHRKTNKGDV